MFPPYYTPKAPISWRTVAKTIASVLMIVLVAQILLQVVTLVYGVGIVGPAIMDRTDIPSYTLFIVLPFFVDLVTISGGVLYAYYLFVVAAIVASVAWIYLSSARGFLLELTGKAKSREHSPLFETAALLFATFFFSVVIGLLVALFGGSTGGLPETTLADDLFSLANASVWEELAVRVLLIGIPLLLIDLFRRSTKKWHKYIIGSGFKFGVPEVLLVLVSAVVFGFAHYEGGWGAWKIIPTSVAGLAFGYLFLKYGLAAGIVLHFTTDYLAMPGLVFSTETGALTIFIGLLAFLWVVLGAVFFTYFTVRLVEFFSRKPITRRPMPVGAAQFYPGANPYAQYQPHYVIPQPQAQTGTAQMVGHPGAQYGYGGYICPVCGNTQARWLGGKFQCLKCGNLS